MPQYLGFSTRNAGKPPTRNGLVGSGLGVGQITSPVYSGKKFVLDDAQLVIYDFVNSLNIRQGEKVGQPQYGTTVWNYVFDPNTTETRYSIQQEIIRVASLDPRIALQFVHVYPSENGVLIEVQMLVLPFNQQSTLNVFFDSTTNTASLQS